jgi:predicted RNase H-like nuclease (RuvC/YqgF family)
MPTEQADLITLHLDDLQAEMEAGSRQIEHIYDSTRHARETLDKRHTHTSELAGLLRRLRELQRSIAEQRKILAFLRAELAETRRATRSPRRKIR